jgi:glycosyltransferase involved in cell wall biosynthesis
MKKLSIITINYNNREGLRKTLHSVASQTFSDFEYIVIDGGSNDGSLDVIKEYSNVISYYVSEKDNGIYNAQNKGIKAATGKYLLFLNSGDFLVDRNVLGKVFQKENDEDIIYGNMRINWGGNNISHGKMPDVISLEHMYKDTLWHPVSFIKKELFDKYGPYDETYQMVADYDFFFRTIIINKVKVKHIDVEVAEFNTGGTSSNPAHKKRETDERKRVLNSYLTPKELKDMEHKTSKNGFFGLLKQLVKQVSDRFSTKEK